MKIYLVTRKYKTPYDAYESMIVIADSVHSAKLICPYKECKDKIQYAFIKPEETWVDNINHLNVEEIGIADSKYTKSCVIHVSFKAG